MTAPKYEFEDNGPMPEIIPVADGITLERLQPMSNDSYELDDFMERNREFFRTYTPSYSKNLTSPLRAEVFIRKALQDGVMLWGLRIGQPRVLAGMVTLVAEEDGSYDVGYVLDEQAQGRGLVTRSVGSLTRQVFAHGGTKVTATTHPENAGSQAVLKRNDFNQIGTDEKGNLVFELLPPT